MSDPKRHGQDPDAPGTPGADRPREHRVDSQWMHEVQREPGPRGRRSPGDAARTVGAGSGGARPRVVLCDEGELEDVFRLLVDLDQRPLRLRPGDLRELADWERPSRLLVSTVRIALSDAVSLPETPDDCVSIAVADGGSHMQCSAMRRRGFRYVVRRPVHPEALRLLLMQVLWRGRESRLVARFPFGAEVVWRRGWRRGRCTMVEISSHGCRLICAEPLRRGDRLRLRVPAALTGSRDLRLRGRVVRRGRLAGAEDGQLQLGVQFEALSPRTLAHLDALLAERASGPAVLAGESAGGSSPALAPRRSPSPRRGGLRLHAPDAAAPSPSPRSGELPEVERRRRPRGVWKQEVLALHREDDRVLHTLLGSDLSVGGVRVEPNPLLRLGDRLRLALYAAGAEPLVLAARVAHDEGRSGVGLVFVEPSEQERARLECMVSALPSLSALDEEGEKEQALVLGEIVSVEARPAGRPRASAGAAEPEHRQPQHDHDAADHHHEEAEAADHEPGQD